MKKYIKEYLNGFNLENREKFLFTSQKTNKPYNRNSISRILHQFIKHLTLIAQPTSGGEITSLHF